MSKLPDSEPRIDLSAIRFPSDKWTIGYLRRICPDGIDVVAMTGEDEDEVVLRRDGRFNDLIGAILENERVYADLVFRKVMGFPSADGKDEPRPDNSGELLANSYLKFELAAGENHARELVHSIESQALAQAEQYSGRGSRS